MNMERCDSHTDHAVDIGELKTRQDRSERDIDGLGNLFRDFSKDISAKLNKLGMKQAYWSGAIAALNVAALILFEIFKK